MPHFELHNGESVMRPDISADTNQLKSDIASGKYPSIARLFTKSKSGFFGKIESSDKEGAKNRYQILIQKARLAELR